MISQLQQIRQAVQEGLATSEDDVELLGESALAEHLNQIEAEARDRESAFNSDE